MGFFDGKKAQKICRIWMHGRLCVHPQHICVCKICQYIRVFAGVHCQYLRVLCVHPYITALQSQSKSLSPWFQFFDINHMPKYQIEDHHRLMRLRHNDLLGWKNPQPDFSLVPRRRNDVSTSLCWELSRVVFTKPRPWTKRGPTITEVFGQKRYLRSLLHIQTNRNHSSKTNLQSMSGGPTFLPSLLTSVTWYLTPFFPRI